MILNEKIVELIKNRSGLCFDKAKDYDILCDKIFSSTNRTIGINTLKRLMGYINDDHNTSDYTLNTIAIYLGHATWEEFCGTIRIDSEWGYEDNSIYINNLAFDTEIEIKYLNRKVNFLVIKYNNQKALRVISALNSSLNPGDILIIYKINKGNILEAEYVIRGITKGNYRTNGEIKSVLIKPAPKS